MRELLSSFIEVSNSIQSSKTETTPCWSRHAANGSFSSSVLGIHDVIMRPSRCSFMDVELQQRAVEYGGLEKMPEVANRNVTAMPPWEKRKSLLLRRFAQKEVSPQFESSESFPTGSNSLLMSMQA